MLTESPKGGAKETEFWKKQEEKKGILRWWKSTNVHGGEVIQNYQPYLITFYNVKITFTYKISLYYVGLGNTNRGQSVRVWGLIED